MIALIRILLLVASVTACARNTAVQNQEKAPSTRYDQGTGGNAIDAQGRQVAPESKWIPCGGTARPDQTNIIDGNRLFVTTESGRQFSLCQILTQNRSQVGIFQVAQLLCQSCQEEAKWVNQQQLNGISHYLIITDARNEMDPQDQNYFRQIAPRSSFFYDHQKTLANDLNNGRAYGTVLVLHRSGEYRLHLSPGLESTWFREAVALSQKNSFGNEQQFGPRIDQSQQQQFPQTPQRPGGQEPIYNYGFTY